MKVRAQPLQTPIRIRVGLNTHELVLAEVSTVKCAHSEGAHINFQIINLK